MKKLILATVITAISMGAMASEKYETCMFFAKDFQSSRAQLSNPKIVNSNKISDDFYVCVIRYDLQKVHYSMPIMVQIDANPKTGVYEFKAI